MHVFVVCGVCVCVCLRVCVCVCVRERDIYRESVCIHDKMSVSLCLCKCVLGSYEMWCHK